MELKHPSTKAGGKGIFKTDTQSVAQWVGNLPLINPEGSAIQLEFALDEINRIEVPIVERFAALELMNEPVAHTTGALKKKYFGKKFPLSGASLEKSRRVVGLHKRMATGYKSMVAVLAESAVEKEQRAQIMHRAICYLSNVLINNYQIYVQYPNGIWRDLHTIYTLAEKQGLQQVAVTDRTTQDQDSCTIEDKYKRMLLLSLSCPYRLSQRAIGNVYKLLGQLAPLSRLHKLDEEGNAGFFACNLASDNPPSYLEPGHKSELNEHWRILNTDGMAEPIRAALEGKQKTGPLNSGMPDEALLERLMLKWGMVPKRRFNRQQQNAPVRLAVGMQAIHHVMTTEPEPETFEDEGDDAETLSPELLYLLDPTLERPTRISTHAPSGHDQSPQTLTLLKGAYAVQNITSEDEPDPDNTQQIESWNMQDMSAGGYCLMWDSEEASNSRVGELVAINTGTDNLNWQLGVVRWMRFTHTKGLGLGIELITPGACPVWAKRFGEHEEAGDRMQAILLPADKGPDQQAVLLLPSMLFRAGNIVQLERDGGLEKVQLTRQIEDTGSFAQFHFAEPD